MNISASVQSDLSKRLMDLPSALSFQVRRKALAEAAEPMRAEAARNAPRDPTAHPPHLADHIIIDALTESEIARSAEVHGDVAVVQIGPSRQVFWGLFSEYGTSRQPARPWFRPAFDQRHGTTLNIYAVKLWAALKGRVSTGGSGSRNL